MIVTDKWRGMTKRTSEWGLQKNRFYILPLSLRCCCSSFRAAFVSDDVPGSDAADALSIQVIGRLNDVVNVDEAECFTRINK